MKPALPSAFADLVPDLVRFGLVRGGSGVAVRAAVGEMVGKVRAGHPTFRHPEQWRCWAFSQVCQKVAAAELPTEELPEPLGQLGRCAEPGRSGYAMLLLGELEAEDSARILGVGVVELAEAIGEVRVRMGFDGGAGAGG